jgi:hypothetical protein
LEGISISVRKDTETGQDVIVGVTKNAWGATALFIARNFYNKFKYYSFLGEEADFVDEFVAELVAIIYEIRRKEHL